MKTQLICRSLSEGNSSLQDASLFWRDLTISSLSTFCALRLWWREVAWSSLFLFLPESPHVVCLLAVGHEDNPLHVLYCQSPVFSALKGGPFNCLLVCTLDKTINLMEPMHWEFALVCISLFLVRWYTNVWPVWQTWCHLFSSLFSLNSAQKQALSNSLFIAHLAVYVDWPITLVFPAISPRLDSWWTFCDSRHMSLSLAFCVYVYIWLYICLDSQYMCCVLFLAFISHFLCSSLSRANTHTHSILLHNTPFPSYIFFISHCLTCCCPNPLLLNVLVLPLWLTLVCLVLFLCGFSLNVLKAAKIEDHSFRNKLCISQI